MAGAITAALLGVGYQYIFDFKLYNSNSKFKLEIKNILNCVILLFL
jgi:hypothetical protein